MLLAYSPGWGQSELAITVDSSNTDHLLFITRDLSHPRMIVAIKQTQTGKIDTVYDNLNLPGDPAKLIFVNILDNKHCVMLVESFFVFVYRYYEWQDPHWKYQRTEVLAWKNREFTTTVEALDYRNIKVRNGAGDFIYRMDLENRKMIKEKIKTDIH